MLKIYLKLQAKEDIENSRWKKGDICEFINNVFSKNLGIAYYPLDRGWEIIQIGLTKDQSELLQYFFR